MSNRNFKEPLQARVPPAQETREVALHMRCPICHEGYGGVGRNYGGYQKSPTLTRRYYECNQCSHTWTIDVTPEQIRIEDAA